jgi:hypothetical protein
MSIYRAFRDLEALGPALIVLSIPMLLRWVPPNRFYGFRVPAALSDRPLWYDANALAGRHMLALGAVMVMLEFVLPVPWRAGVLSPLGLVGLVVITIADWRTANQWRRQRESAKGKP